MLVSLHREYYENIKIVDEGIQEMTSLIEEYFNNDGKTSYILTSDHGMTDWGVQFYISVCPKSKEKYSQTWLFRPWLVRIYSNPARNGQEQFFSY